MARAPVFEGLLWTAKPVAFHWNNGLNIQLSNDDIVATRVRGEDNAIVCTSQPVPTGQMFCVTVKEKSRWPIGGMKVGFTGDSPESLQVTGLSKLRWRGNQGRHLLHCVMSNICYNGSKIASLKEDIGFFKAGKSFGMLLTRERELHWFVDYKWEGMVRVSDYPVDEPTWGVVDVAGKILKVTAAINNVSSYDQSSERLLLEMGLINSPPPPTYNTARPQANQPTGTIQSIVVSQLLREQAALKEKIEQKDESVVRLTRTIQDLRRVIQQQQEVADEAHHFLQQLSDAIDAEDQALIATLRQCINVLQHRITSLSVANRSFTSYEVEFWQVSPEEVAINDDQVIGRGAWGYIAKGTFRGTAVAVKRVYPAIFEHTSLERVHREIRTMAQIRHPNLVLFIAAVLNERTGPMIVMELLDTSLRSASQANRIGANKRMIFRDVSSALTYLHAQREPIIHRDVSSANVLLVSQPNDTWLAKLSDFGSANLAQAATTLGEGAIVYTAPEAYPHPPTSPTPRPPQTIKIDVYSFGVVACEVVTSVFPETHRLGELLERVGHEWPEIHPLITSCVSHSPQSRPSMETVLSQIKQMDWEP